MKKRADLQGIRGMAITSVLLYHFFPKIFKNGYVGVDQFFILSGFLMTEILSRESSLSTSGLFSFYYRRMKRILPLYALFIFCTLLFSLLVFPISTFDYNIPHAIRSLAFISNTKQEDSKLTYERMLSDAEVLYTHTWSLSCEVQFYAIAPFLILMPAFVAKEFAIAVICLTSYFFFTYLWENGSQQFAFNFMFTRIWQFSLGILCSLFLRENNCKDCFEPLISKKEDLDYCCFPNNKELRLYSNLSNIICFSLMLVCWFPLEISPHFVRLLVCCLTAGLIYSGQIFPNLLLSNRIVVYLGDISYSLYLIHWPIYVYLKQIHFDSPVGSLLGILFAILIAAIIYETFEKFYLKLKKTGIISLTLFLYMLCAMLIVYFSSFNPVKPKTEVDAAWKQFKIPENLTLEMVRGLNRKFSDIDMSLLEMSECSYTRLEKNDPAPWGMCQFNNSYFTGTKRFMLIGNSYAPNIARLFIKLEECQKKAKEIQMYSRMACEVLDDTGDVFAKRCLNISEKFQEAVLKVKPDILFITTRHMTSMLPVKGSIDSILEMEKERLKRLELNVKEKVYILNALPRPRSPQLTKLINEDFLRRNGTSQDHLIDKLADFSLARKRMAILAKQCTKCELIDIMPSFINNGTFQMYNEQNGIAYFVDYLHLSDYGLQKISNVYRNVCKNIK